MAIKVNGQNIMDYALETPRTRIFRSAPMAPGCEVFCRECLQWSAHCAVSACGSRQAVLRRRLAREGRPNPIDYTGADVRELMEAA